MMRRREFITLLGGAAATWPVVARAQQARVPVIGILGASSVEASEVAVVAFRQGLGEIGYVEGRNVTIEYHWLDGQYDRAPTVLLDMVRRRVSIIVTLFGTRNVLSAKQATSTIPIVFYAGTDPVAAGLVASLGRSGGNITGVTDLAVELGPKRIELLRELVPDLATVAAFVNTASSASIALGRQVEMAVNHLGMNFQAVNVAVQSDFEPAFDDIRRNRVGSLLVSGDSLYSSSRELIVRLAAHHYIPVIYYSREYADAGGLMSYGPSVKALSRQVGSYAGRILNGTKPSDLPVIQPTIFELVIDVKTAKALGLAVPPSLLARADEVIE
jgi:putative ABC transport system substrate-binding protein